MRRLIAVALGIGIVAFAASPAFAQNRLEIGIGAKGGGLFGGATEVPESSAPGGLYGENGNWENGSDPELYGLFGGGAGGGPALDIRYNKLIGLETAVYFTNDTTEGTNSIENQDGEVVAEVTQTQKTTATHVPVLLKISPPFERVRPVFGLGLEVVTQNKAKLSYESDGAPNRTEQLNRFNEGTPSSYTMFQVTAGVEIDAGPIRVPIELRTGYNVGWNDKYDARVEKKADKQIYDGAYMGHFGAYAGILYRWDVAL